MPRLTACERALAAFEKHPDIGTGRRLVAAIGLYLDGNDKTDGLAELSAGVVQFLAAKHNDPEYLKGAVVYVHPSEM